MDNSPIYCAEQINVPVDLGDILKAFTKEVIRKQPADLLQFSAKYFSSLAQAATAAPKATPPSKQQLRQLHAQLAASGAPEALPLQEALAACVAAGISAATASQVAGSVSSATGEVAAEELQLLLLAMTGSSLAATLQSMFELVGTSGQLGCSTFLRLFAHLARRDPELGEVMLQKLGDVLAGREQVGYSELCADGPLKARLAVL